MKLRPLFLAMGLGLLVLAAGCPASGVGDPCAPEAVPGGNGFDRNEAYLETSSVQCRTRVCMVYQFAGRPDPVLGDPECTTGDCPTQEEVDSRVYCTCRCDAPAGSGTPTCECPDGFSCVPILELGGDGIRGSYCVKSDTVSDT